jgi:hypothetical protein
MESRPQGSGYDGWERLGKLAYRLARHLSFEHLESSQLRGALVDLARRYRSFSAGTRPGIRQLAAEFLDDLAREPMRRTIYLGVHDLNLPDDTSIGEARFICVSQNEALAQSFAHFREKAPELVCAVEAAGRLYVYSPRS